MKIDKTIILEESDYYEAIKDYLKKKLDIELTKVCSISYRASSGTDRGEPTMSVLIQQEVIKT